MTKASLNNPLMKSSADLYLTFTILSANSAGDKLMMFFFFFYFQKTGFDISCKLPPLEKICMKGQNPLSGKNKN